jgi:hypothetical protein
MSDDAIARAIDVMTDVQRRSAEAAGALVERLVSSVDGRHADDEPAEPDDRLHPPTDAEDAMAGMAKLWRDSITSLATALSGNPAAPATARIDVNAGAIPSPLRVVLDADTSTGEIEVWLHNPSSEAFDKLRVHCGAPVAHDGSTIDADALVANPDAFDLPARSSRGVEITIEAPDTRPGVYRALVLVDGLPDQWLPLEIVVPQLPA